MYDDFRGGNPHVAHTALYAWSNSGGGNTDTAWGYTLTGNPHALQAQSAHTHDELYSSEAGEGHIPTHYWFAHIHKSSQMTKNDPPKQTLKSSQIFTICEDFFHLVMKLQFLCFRIFTDLHNLWRFALFATAIILWRFVKIWRIGEIMDCRYFGIS